MAEARVTDPALNRVFRMAAGLVGPQDMVLVLVLGRPHTDSPDQIKVFAVSDIERALSDGQDFVLAAPENVMGLTMFEAIEAKKMLEESSRPEITDAVGVLALPDA